MTIGLAGNTIWNAVNSIAIGNVNHKVNITNKNLSHICERVDMLDRNVKHLENDVWGDSSTPTLLERAVRYSSDRSAALTQQAFINTMGVDPWYQQQGQGQPPQVMPGVQVPNGAAQAAPVTTNVTVAPPQSQQANVATPLTEESVKAMITQIIADMAANTQQPTNNKK